MTKRQRHVIFKSLFAAALIIWFFVFIDRRWMEWVLIALYPVVMLLEQRRERRRRIDLTALIQSSILLQIWLIACLVIIVTVVIATLTSIYRFDERLGTTGMILLFVIALVPIWLAGVRQRYLEYGEDPQQQAQ
jgi:sterol desaturase/sphingolipid hydroxylase (fatty acid hydroxylase superfamily)